MSTNLLESVILDIQPAQEVFRIEPDIIQDTVARFVACMGGEPQDLRHVRIIQDKQKIRITASLLRDSGVFVGDQEEEEDDHGLALLRSVRPKGDKTAFTAYATEALRQLGFLYYDTEEEEDVNLVEKRKTKKFIELEFPADIVLAIITNSNFADEFFFITPIEVTLKKNKYKRHDFKGVKKQIVVAQVSRSRKESQNDGYSPAQVAAWKMNLSVEELEDDEDDE